MFETKKNTCCDGSSDRRAGGGGGILPMSGPPESSVHPESLEPKTLPLIV